MSEYNRALNNAIAFGITSLIVIALIGMAVVSLEDRNAKLTNKGETPTEIGD